MFNEQPTAEQFLRTLFMGKSAWKNGLFSGEVQTDKVAVVSQSVWAALTIAEAGRFIDTEI